MFSSMSHASALQGRVWSDKTLRLKVAVAMCTLAQVCEEQESNRMQTSPATHAHLESQGQHRMHCTLPPFRRILRSTHLRTRLPTKLPYQPCYCAMMQQCMNAVGDWLADPPPCRTEVMSQGVAVLARCSLLGAQGCRQAFPQLPYTRYCIQPRLECATASSTVASWRVPWPATTIAAAHHIVDAQCKHSSSLLACCAVTLRDQDRNALL